MSKHEEIKQTLAAATPGPWEVVNLGDLHIAKGYRKEGSQHVAQWIAEMYFETDQEEDQAFDDAKLIANAPEYIAYLLEENERLRKELEEAKQAMSDSHHHAESLYQIIQRGDLNTLDLIQADGEYESFCKIIKAPVGQEGEGTMNLINPDDFPWYHKLWLIPLALIVMAYQWMRDKFKG